MRRKEKYITNGTLWGAGLTAGVDIFLQWYEHRQNGTKLTWETFDGWRTFRRALVGGVTGAGFGYLYYEYVIAEEEKMPFNPDEFLQKVLSGENLRSDPDKLEFLKSKHRNIKQWLVDKFGNKLVAHPEDVGSYKKGTAIISNIDFDIILPFGKYSYPTLDSMYDDVHYKLVNEFGVSAIITKHSKAINLAFKEGVEVISFDIVPGRERNNYPVDRELSLYARPNWFWQRGTSFKVNVSQQSTRSGNGSKAQKVIKLLKCYRDRNDFPLPSVIIEQCVGEALISVYGEHPSDSVNLLNSMELIAKRLANKTIIDPANSNNNLNNKISDYYRTYISSKLIKDVDIIDSNPRYLKEIFPL